MFRELLRAKIHRATVTDANLNYVGSLSIDTDLMEAADIQAYEKIAVVNINTGARFETYAIEAPAGSGTIALNGGAARLGHPGDLVIIIAYGFYQEADPHRAKVVFVDERNRIVSTSILSREANTHAALQADDKSLGDMVDGLMGG